MSFGAGGYPALEITAPDSDREVICRGCRRLTCQITNQQVYITFGVGDPPQYGMPEPYLPFVGQLIREFDAFKVRAAIPAANLIAPAKQAVVKLLPLPWPH